MQTSDLLHASPVMMMSLPKMETPRSDREKEERTAERKKRERERAKEEKQTSIKGQSVCLARNFYRSCYACEVVVASYDH